MRNVSAIDVARGSAINLYDSSSVLQATLVASAGGVSITGSITGSSTVQGTRLISTIATGTAPLTVSSTTLVTNLNADLLDSQHGSYYLDATNATLPTTWVVKVAETNAEPFLFGTYGDAVAYRTISNLQYWDGATWQTYSNSNIQALLTGNIQNTAAIVAPANKKFRFEFTAALSYLGNGVLVVHQTWNQGAHQVSSMLEYWNGSAWVTAIAEATSPAGEENYHFYNRGAFHGGWTQYRITITGADAVNSATYTGIQLLFDYSRTTVPNNFLPMTWDWQRNVTTTGTLTGSRLISTVAIGTAPLTVTSTTLVANLNADYLDGQHASYYENRDTTAVGFSAGTLTLTRAAGNLTVSLDGRYLPLSAGSSVWLTDKLRVHSTQPGIILTESDTTDKNRWIDIEGGTFRILKISDALAVLATQLTIDENGLLASTNSVTGAPGANQGGVKINASITSTESFHKIGLWKETTVSGGDHTYQRTGLWNTIIASGANTFSSLVGYTSFVSVAAGATVSNYTAYLVNSPTATGNITVLSGLNVTAQPSTNVDTVYGVYSALATVATKTRYFLYGAGNAPSYFAGDVSLSSGSTTVKANNATITHFAGWGSIPNSGSGAVVVFRTAAEARSDIGAISQTDGDARYLRLTGGTLSGGLTGTTASFSSTITGSLLIEKSVSFTPTTTGWYRVISGSVAATGRIILRANYDNKYGDLEFFYTTNGWGQIGSVNLVSYNGYVGAIVDQIRISGESASAGCYLDLNIASATSPVSITVYAYGPLSAALVSSPVVGAVAGPANVHTVTVARGFATSHQFRSEIATGTAPMVVASTTKVTNLNADLLDGNDSAYFLNTSSATQTKAGNLQLTNGTTDMALLLGPTVTGNTGNGAALNLYTGLTTNPTYWHLVARGDSRASYASYFTIFYYNGTSFIPAINMAPDGKVIIGSSSVTSTAVFQVEADTANNRRLLVGTGAGVANTVVVRGDDNSVGAALRLQNLDSTAAVLHGFRIRFELATTAAATVNAGAVDVVKEAEWTSTASTQDSSMLFLLTENGAMAEKARLTSSGQLGIGTTSPQSSAGDGRAVHIASSTRTEFRAATASGATLKTGASTTVGYIGTEGSHDLQLQTANTARLTISAAGVCNFSTTPTSAGSTIWHAGNDGTGSGLDADLWWGASPRSLLGANGSAAFGGAYWSGSDWVHESATADYAFTLRHDATAAGALQVLLFPTVSAGVGTTAGSPQYFQFMRDGQLRVPNIRVTSLATGIMRNVSGANAASVTGTSGYVTRWTANDNIGVGTLQDDGTNVGVGVAPSTYKFRVNGTAYVSGAVTLASDISAVASITMSGNLWITQGDPRIIFDETDGGTNQRYWDFLAQGGIFFGRLYEDNRASGVSTNWVSVTRSATTISNVTFGGPVYVPGGSVSAPSLAFSTDTNTGLYGGSDNLYLVAGGIEMARFYSGAAIFGDIATDATNKTVRFMTRHYTNAEEPMILATTQSVNGAGSITFGGGTALGNAPTNFSWVAASNGTTLGTSSPLRMALNYLNWAVATRPVVDGMSLTAVSGGTLVVSTVYYWVVTAVDGYGETTVSSEVTYTPTSGSQTVQIFWNKSAGATNYKVWRRTSAMTWTDGNSKLIATVASSVNSYTDNGVAASAGSPATIPNALSIINTYSTGYTTMSAQLGVMSDVDPDYALTVAGGEIAGSAVVAAGAKIGSLVAGSSGSGYGVVGDNVRFSATSGTFLYDRTDFASLIDFDLGTIRMRTAASGSAGGTISLTTRLQVTNAGSVVLGTAALATNATDGFLYVPTCAGAPSGTPTSHTGRAPIIVDSSNNRVYVYVGGSWRYAALT